MIKINNDLSFIINNDQIIFTGTANWKYQYSIDDIKNNNSNWRDLRDSLLEKEVRLIEKYIKNLNFI